MARRRAGKLYTLSEVAAKTGISLASLRRYRASYPERVPSVGAGRRQRFPATALPVFQQLKEEGMARRGRGARKTGGATAKPTAKSKRGADSLLTLVEIGKRTGISYPTLLRYVRLHLDRLPHTGNGRKRRFRPAAVAEFQKLRGESRRGRRAAARPTETPALQRQLAKLERGQRSITRQLRDLRRALARPVRIRVER